ncbi:AAA family ATPase [Streptomyces anthocyanicus]|uniref:AAA family ATPase n=1 Tax=Streptomyces TaxID=1883 RepID=UPI00177CDCB5|nr:MULTISPECIES: MoxR family ATPase [Streptomyces]MBQ0947881.1 MoxR family ATPase [Streptomyces sp. RK76]MDX3346430.1 MoxR family ATPase [Streptomyces sp. ME02-6979A]WTC51115.1 MoxR family ATPase [Streptomyces anthocyanicus]
MANVPQHPHPRKGDRRDGSVYSPTPEIITAVQVALITGRPLLLAGPPGCGKSSLAGFVARTLDFAYLEFVVTDESSPQDLLWNVDVIARLRDAQLATAGEKVPPLHDYIDPGPLWWALNPASAARRGADDDVALSRPCSMPVHLKDYEPQGAGAVLLIDEIDKAESSFCNGLLVPLGSRQFHVTDIDETVENGADRAPESPLVIITTNGERDLPDAFVRRCVVLPVEGPDAERLEEIARLHFPDVSGDSALSARVRELAGRFTKSAKDHASTAEFLDLVSVMITFGGDSDSDQWQLVERLVVEKSSVRRNLFTSW